MGARLIIVSNRVAVPETPRAPLAGGMAVAVKAALKNRNGMWFGWSGKVAEERNGEPHVVDVNKITYVLIDLSQNDIQEYYNGLANSVLWPILHYRVDLQEYSRADASGYMRVNRLFADRLSKLLREDDVIWVHDYHLMLLGRELDRAGIEIRSDFSFTPLVRRRTSCRPCRTTGKFSAGCPITTSSASRPRMTATISPATWRRLARSRFGAMRSKSRAGKCVLARFRSASKRKPTCALRVMRAARR